MTYYLKMTLYATLFTWLVTALGALTVFLFKKISNKLMAFMFGFGAGVMIAASIFSLIIPGVDLANEMNQIGYIVIGLGVLLGGVVIFLLDLFIDKNITTTKISKNKILLILAITLHNIPEGMAIGVAFGAAMNDTGLSLLNAWGLALGIGIQNFPEGMAVSLPLKTEGMKKRHAFFFGQFSGMVEPISAIIGFLLISIVKTILPFILGFAAGAMLYVVADELIPSSKISKDSKYGTFGVLIGFVIMMVLDIALS